MSTEKQEKKPGVDRLEYKSPLEGRYTSEAMRKLFGDQKKFSTWRRFWLALAKAEKALGLAITDDQIAEMAAHIDDIDFAAADAYEKQLRHDVMAHIKTFGDAAPLAKPIIHLGATSMEPGDNTDVILMREAMDLIIIQLANVIDTLAKFAVKHKKLPCLGFTHFQPAQLVTVGKRAALWCSDFVRDLNELERRRNNLEFRGVKGATGTQSSYLDLFGGDRGKVRELDRLVAAEFGFKHICTITSQTYSRKVDAEIVFALAGIGISAHKLFNDVRLLAGLKEIEEPFEKDQVGSSAMAYKRNPMRSERATGLSRWLMNISPDVNQNAAEQWLDRTLDDSANRRLAISEAFLTADAVLTIVLNVAQGMVVYPKVIEAHLAAELPFMATENILMEAVKAGGDRQDLHESIRVHSQAAAEQVKMHGKPNDLIQRLKGDAAFANVDIDAIMDPRKFIGRAPEQVSEFVRAEVRRVRRRYGKFLGQKGEVKV